MCDTIGGISFVHLRMTTLILDEIIFPAEMETLSKRIALGGRRRFPHLPITTFYSRPYSIV